MKRHIDLTNGSLGGHILWMTPPMMIGCFAMIAFNLPDAWFVSRLSAVLALFWFGRVLKKKRVI